MGVPLGRFAEPLTHAHEHAALHLHLLTTSSTVGVYICGLMGPYRRWAWRFCASCAPVNLALIFCVCVWGGGGGGGGGGGAAIS